MIPALPVIVKLILTCNNPSAVPHQFLLNWLSSFDQTEIPFLRKDIREEDNMDVEILHSFANKSKWQIRHFYFKSIEQYPFYDNLWDMVDLNCI